MSEQRNKSRRHQKTRGAMHEMSGEPDGEPTFPGVQQQSQHARRRPRDSRDVGRADISAARFANVGAAKKFSKNHANGREPSR